VRPFAFLVVLACAACPSANEDVDDDDDDDIVVDAGNDPDAGEPLEDAGELIRACCAESFDHPDADCVWSDSFEPLP
jgi:hypothetical protein